MSKTIYKHQPKEVAFRRWIVCRDGYRCQRCKTRSTARKPIALDVHHIDRRKDPKKLFDAANCITLCPKCHAKVQHEHPDYEHNATIAKRKREERNREYMKRLKSYRDAVEKIGDDFGRDGDFRKAMARLRRVGKKFGY